MKQTPLSPEQEDELENFLAEQALSNITHTEETIENLRQVMAGVITADEAVAQALEKHRKLNEEAQHNVSQTPTGSD